MDAVKVISSHWQQVSRELDVWPKLQGSHDKEYAATCKKDDADVGLLESTISKSFKSGTIALICTLFLFQTLKQMLKNPAFQFTYYNLWVSKCSSVIYQVDLCVIVYK